MAQVIGNRTFTASLGNRFAEIRTQAVENFAAWRVYRRTFAELQSLSARELADLGIARSNIRNLALEAAYGKSA